MVDRSVQLHRDALGGTALRQQAVQTIFVMQVLLLGIGQQQTPFLPAELQVDIDDTGYAVKAQCCR